MTIQKSHPEFEKITRRKKREDQILKWLCISCFGVVGLFLLSVVVGLLILGLSRLNLDFFLQFPSRHAIKAGILPAWVGSLIVMSLTAIFATIIGVATGIYLELYANRSRLNRLIEISVLTLAGIPSILYGLLGLTIFVQFLGFGESILTASLTLTILVLPIIIVTTRETVKTIPKSWEEGAYALGATKSKWFCDHLLSYSLSGIITGVVLAMARAIGETAPLIVVGALSFVAFLPQTPISLDFPFINFDFLFDAFTVLPIQSFNWINRPDEKFQVNAAAANFVLLTTVIILNMIAQIVRIKSRKKIQY